MKSGAGAIVYGKILEDLRSPWSWGPIESQKHETYYRLVRSRLIMGVDVSEERTRSLEESVKDMEVNVLEESLV